MLTTVATATPPKTWYRFENAATPAPRVADINIVDFIGGWGEDFFGDSLTAKAFLDDLAKLPESIKTIRVHVNSPGGDVFAAVNIANALRDQRVTKQRTVDMHVEGLAASAASIIIMAGSTIRINDNALVMIHNPWSMAAGDARDMRDIAEKLDKIRQSIITTYQWQSKLSAEKIGALMDATTWMDADEAIAHGFATEKVKGLKAAASYDASALEKLAIPDKYRARLHALLPAAGGRAALGTSSTIGRQPPAGVSASVRVRVTPHQDRDMKKTYSEQIKEYEATRAAHNARMDAILDASSETGETPDPEQQQEHDDLGIKVKAIDDHLVRLHAAEARQKDAAVPVNGANPEDAAKSRSGVVVLKKELPKATAFTRYAMALAAGRGSRLEAKEYAQQRWKDSTPEVAQVLNAAMTAGTTTDSDWAAPLVVYQNMANEFVELLRPATIIGRIPGLRKVPFNVTMPTQTQGSTVGWVGQTKPKAVSELKFGQLSLGMAKAAGIVVLSEELVRSSSPSAEAIVRQDLIATMAQFLDLQFVDPAVAAVSNVSPASITNGATVVDSTGTTAAAFRVDFKTAMATYLAANLSLSGSVLLMTETQALAFSMMQNALGQPEFPTISMNGGTLMGIPVIASENIPSEGGSPAGNRIILVKASEILVADEGGVTLDVSREASLQMNSAPDDPQTASTVMVSLWQNNLVGLRAERFINWVRRRAEAVVVLEGAVYVG